MDRTTLGRQPPPVSFHAKCEMTRKSPYKTPFDAWLRANGIKPLTLARKAGMSRQTISRLRRGLGSGTPRTRQKLIAACTALVRRPVTVFELFGDTE
jgi:DNA-binding Xre family transcriptional regulator